MCVCLSCSLRLILTDAPEDREGNDDLSDANPSEHEKPNTVEVEQNESQAQKEEEEDDEMIQNEEEKALEQGSGVFCKEEIINTEIEIVHTREEEEENVMEDRKENEIVAEPVVVDDDKQQEDGTGYKTVQKELEIGIDNLKEEVKVLRRKVRHRANSEIKRLEVCQEEEEEEDVLVEETEKQIDIYRELVSDLSIFSFALVTNHKVTGSIRSH